MSRTEEFLRWCDACGIEHGFCYACANDCTCHDAPDCRFVIIRKEASAAGFRGARS